MTSDRSGFRTDTPEYESFVSAMEHVMQDVRKELGRLSDRKETQKVKQALKEAIDRIQQALGSHPDFVETGLLPLGQETDAVGEPGQISRQMEDTTPDEQPGEEETEAKDSTEQNSVSDDQADYQTKDAKEKKPRVKRLTPNAVIRKIAVGDHLVSCCLDYFGESTGVLHPGTDHLY